MKKNIYFYILIVFFFSILILLLPKNDNDLDIRSNEFEEVRAVYFSYIEFSNYITDKSDEEQKNNIISILDNVKNLGFNRVIVHVRPFSDSIYKSTFYPISSYVLNDEGNYPNFDVLDFFINESHKRGIKFDAWVNPYRISNSPDISKLSSNSLYFKYKDTDVVGVTENGIYFNPASEEAQELIINGIKEIVKKYHVDGVHFDDYFYPDKKIDLYSYSKYINSLGTLNLVDYRLSNVKNLIRNVYSSIKGINSDITFGIAPQGNIDNCYNDSFLDVREILSNDGYVDYIMPQIYFGFLNEIRPFKDTINDWNNMIKNSNVKLIPALAFYKIGKFDRYALSGSNEWIQNNDIISREIDFSRKMNNYYGFSLFSYNYIFNDNYSNDNIVSEISNMKDILK